MSDPITTPTTPTTPAAPVDTTAVAAHALESLEQAQSAPAPPPAAPAAPGAPAAPAPTPGAPAIELSEAESLLREQGYQSERKPDGREHWIPRSKVLKMIESGLKKRGEAMEKERVQWQAHQSRAAEALQQIQRWRQLMDGDPHQLLAQMAQADPRYRVYLDSVLERQRQAEPADPEPEPDIDLGNGRKTYSLEGIRAVRAWERRQMERAMNERLAPFAQRAEREAHAQRQAQIEATLRERTNASITKARTWPRFADHEEAILTVLQEDTRASQAAGLPPQKSLHDAYMEVVGGNFSVDQQRVREQVLKELNGAPRSTGVTSNGAEAVRKPAALTTEEIARRAWNRLEGRG